MNELLRTRATVVWGALVLATLVSVWLGADHGQAGPDGRTFGVAAALVVAFVKIRFIGLDFMELRAAPLVLRLAFEVWCAAAGTVVLLLFLAGG